MYRIPSPGRPSAASPLLGLLAAPVIAALSGCTDIAQMFARPESKSGAPTTQAQPAVASEQDKIPSPQEKPKPGKLYEWNGDGRHVTRIVVSTDEQKARFYDGDEQIGWTTVASGVKAHPTPTGSFEVIEKVANKKSNLYGKVYGSGGKVVRSDFKAGRDPIPAGARFEGAKMPYYLRITYDGVGLHAGPIPHPGRPASHGCIRMPARMAPLLFEHVSVGTKVNVIGSGPSYGNYVQRQRALAAERLAQAKAAQERETARLAQGSTADLSLPGQSAQAAPLLPASAVAESAASSTPATERPQAPRPRPSVPKTASAPKPRPVAPATPRPAEPVVPATTAVAEPQHGEAAAGGGSSAAVQAPVAAETPAPAGPEAAPAAAPSASAQPQEAPKSAEKAAPGEHAPADPSRQSPAAPAAQPVVTAPAAQPAAAPAVAAPAQTPAPAAGAPQAQAEPAKSGG